jgi:hypothetical protein
LDGEIDLSVSGGITPYTYNWLGGQTTQDVTGLSEGMHYCLIGDANGCSELYIVNLIGGISANNSSSKFTVGSGKFNFYPNPTKNNINVSVNSDVITKSEIIIYDINMKVVLQKEINVIKGNNYFELNVKTLNAGVYVIGINSKGIKTFQKLIIE